MPSPAPQVVVVQAPLQAMAADPRQHGQHQLAHGPGQYAGPPGAGWAQPAGPRPETPFFSDNVCTITNARAILRGTTYALGSITSVRTWTVPKPSWPLLLGILCVLVGLAIAVSNGGCGGIVTIVGVALLVLHFAAKDKHYVMIGTAGREIDALQSSNGAYINQVVTALNSAIIHRG